MAEFASNGKGNLGVTLGAIGTGLGIMNNCGGGGLGGIFSGNGGGCCSENTPVTRYELNMALNSAAKDSKIALLEANIFTDSKINELGNRNLATFNELRGELREIAVYQGVNTATIQCLKGQVDQLQGLTKTVVPSYNICNQDYPVVVTNTACNPVLTQAVPASAS